MSLKVQTTCDQCGWTSRPCRSEAQADYAYRRHSCERHHRLRERAARGEARMAAVDRTPKPCLHKRTDHQHGTYACYVLDNCRCLPCAFAQSEYQSNRERQHAYGRWNGLVDAQPARDHVAQLMAGGMNLKLIAARSGVSHGSLSKLVYGEYGRAPSRRIRPDTERRLLVTELGHADGHRVDNTGTVRRLQALVALGYSQLRLATELGMHQANFHKLMHANSMVTAATRRAVRELYEAWSMHPPQPTEWRGRISVNRARNYARARGWLPPLAWDDESIDDPAASPLHTDDVASEVDEVAVARRMGGDQTVTLTRDERLALVERLTRRGMSAKSIAALTGYHPRQVTRDRADLAAERGAAA